MKPNPASARVLVSSDNTDDANQILKQLKQEFEHVHISTREDRVVEDFDEFKPDVLVLAFDSLDKAQRYYLGLYRLGQFVHQHPHRTVVLCDKAEVRAVFELCKKEYFDDYVLYWPQTHDGPRLAMSIWMACREMMALHSAAPSNSELRAHAQQLGDLERVLERQMSDGEQRLAAARGSLSQAESEVEGAIDQFSDRLARGTADGWVEVKNSAALGREIDALKQAQIASTRKFSARSIEPLSSWANNLREQIEPALAGTRVLADQVREIRPIVMVVEDDELARLLVKRTLDPQVYATIFVEDGTAALSQMKRVKPDVVLMDIRLPGLDGLTLTQRLKATPHLSDIPVIMMTGDARRETLIHSVEAGASEFVIKPFTRESLTSKIDKVLRR